MSDTAGSGVEAHSLPFTKARSRFVLECSKLVTLL